MMGKDVSENVKCMFLPNAVIVYISCSTCAYIARHK